MFGLAQQTLAINKQALGRIVAAFERERVFISPLTQFGRAIVHDAFRGLFQLGNWISAFATTASCASNIGRGGRRRWRLRPTHRQFIRRMAGQFFGPLRLARLAHGRRNLGPRISRRTFQRRLDRLSRLDWRVFGRVNRHRIATFFSRC